jgi:hypothetical protein
MASTQKKCHKRHPGPWDCGSTMTRLAIFKRTESASKTQFNIHPE